MLGNHAGTSYLYDLRGELVRQSNYAPDGHLLSDYAALTYDGNGNLTGLTATIPGARQLSGTTCYTYDGTGQLTQEQSTRDNNYTRAYSYDAAGNPTHFGSLSGSILQYNSNNQLIDSSYAYDGNGNPTLYHGNHLTFDTANHLTQFADANNNILMTAGYRADGLRAWKETYDRNHNPHRRYFLYDGEQLLCELDITGNVLNATTWGATGLLREGKPGICSISKGMSRIDWMTAAKYCRRICMTRMGICWRAGMRAIQLDLMGDGDIILIMR